MINKSSRLGPRERVVATKRGCSQLKRCSTGWEGVHGVWRVKVGGRAWRQAGWSPGELARTLFVPSPSCAPWAGHHLHIMAISTMSSTPIYLSGSVQCAALGIFLGSWSSLSSSMLPLPWYFVKKGPLSAYRATTKSQISCLLLVRSKPTQIWT